MVSSKHNFNLRIFPVNISKLEIFPSCEGVSKLSFQLEIDQNLKKAVTHKTMMRLKTWRMTNDGLNNLGEFSNWWFLDGALSQSECSIIQPMRKLVWKINLKTEKEYGVRDIIKNRLFTKLMIESRLLVPIEIKISDEDTKHPLIHIGTL